MAKVLYQTTGKSTFTCTFSDKYSENGGGTKYNYPSYTIVLPIESSSIGSGETYTHLQAMPAYTASAIAENYNTTYHSDGNATLGSREMCSNLLMNNYSSKIFTNTIFTEYPNAYNKLYPGSEYILTGLKIVNDYKTSVIDYNKNKSKITDPKTAVEQQFPIVKCTLDYPLTSSMWGTISNESTGKEINSFTEEIQNIYNSKPNYGALNCINTCNNVAYKKESTFLQGDNLHPIVGTTILYSNHTYAVQKGT
jgi:hypothetical protein